MAAGITQPGGAGTGIIMEDSSHADAGGDGYYDPIDIATKFPADFVDAAFPWYKVFRCKVPLTNGDGVGTAITKFRVKDCIVVFDSAKSYSVSAVGVSNRTTELGVKQGTNGASNPGYLYFTGIGITIRGILNIYAGDLYNGSH